MDKHFPSVLLFPSLPSSHPVGQVSIGMWRRSKKASPFPCCPCLASVPLTLALSLSSCPGLWCLTQTRVGDTHRNTHIVKDTVWCDEWPPGQRDGCYGAPLLFSPPCHPRGPAPVPALAPGMSEGAEKGLLRSGRPFSDVVERLTRRTADNPPLPIVPAPIPFIVYFFLKNVSLYFFGTRDRLKITKRCGRPGDLRG